MTRVIIAGAGVVGTSLAFYLAESGASVTVIDRDRPGSGTTSASFAWINANQKTPREYFDLNLAGMVEHARLAARLASAPWYHPTGNLYWTDDPEQHSELQQRVERLQSWGYAAEWRDADAVNRELEPEIRFASASRPVAWFPDEGWLNGPAFVRGMLEHAKAHGAVVRSGSAVTGIDNASGTLSVHLEGEESLAADTFVNAAGPAADQIASLVGRRLPLGPTRGLLVRVAVPHNPIRRVIHSTRVNLRPDEDGYVLLHHDSIDALIGDRSSIALEDDLVRELFARAREVLPSVETGELTETRVGVRPYPIDGVSCVGAVQGVDGYYEAVTHSGITLGPIIGRLLSRAILEGDLDPPLAPFNPDRFLTLT